MFSIAAILSRHFPVLQFLSTETGLDILRTVNGRTDCYPCRVQPSAADETGNSTERKKGHHETPNATLKAKFHYASLFGAGSELAPKRFAASSEPASVMEFSFYESRLLPLVWTAVAPTADTHD